jgi:hypothetical protein
LEQAVGGSIKSPLQLFGNGSVGSQSLVGQAWLRTLQREGLALRQWPFEVPGRVTVVEQFFSMPDWFPERERGVVLDERQVKAVVRGVRRRMNAGEDLCATAQFGALNEAERRAVRREEGWLAGFTATRGKVRQNEGGRHGDTRGH